jgi:hypothetical protein
MTAWLTSFHLAVDVTFRRAAASAQIILGGCIFSKALDSTLAQETFADNVEGLGK